MINKKRFTYNTESGFLSYTAKQAINHDTLKKFYDVVINPVQKEIIKEISKERKI